MVIPKGKTVHEDLSTSYTDIDELLRDLRQNSFTGYCQVNFWEYRGTLFLDRGRIINAFEEVGNNEVSGEKAIKSILERAKEKDGTVSVFQLSDEMVATLASVLNSNVKYRDLTTELTSLEKLISKLKREEHSGYVEVLLNNDSGDGCIYFQDGRAMESVFRASDGEMISGPSGLKKILGLSTEVGAIFNVFESDLSSIVVDNTVSDDVIQLFQETLNAIQRAIDGQCGNGKFTDEFKRMLATNANKYLFLDPFAGEFVYKDHALTFEGETTLDEFTTGLCDVINQTLEHFINQNDHVAEAVYSEIQPLKESQIQLIDRFQLDMKMPAVFGDYMPMPENHDKAEGEKGPKPGGLLNRIIRRKGKPAEHE
jgi:hypothetical protein